MSNCACRCSCGVRAADVEGVNLDMTLTSNRIVSIAGANIEHSHKDMEIDRLRIELSIERARSEKLESDLSLFVKERSLEIEKLNLTIASLENKNAPTSAAPVNNNNSKINKNTLMNENNRNGHRNNGHHNNNGLNQSKSQNVSSQPFISAPVNNRDFDRVLLHDNRDLQNKALQVNQIANMPEKQPISDWIGFLPLIDIPTKVKNNQYSNGNTSNKPSFPKRHRMKTPPYRTGHRHQSLEWLSHLHLVHQLCKR